MKYALPAVPGEDHRSGVLDSSHPYCRQYAPLSAGAVSVALLGTDLQLGGVAEGSRVVWILCRNRCAWHSTEVVRSVGGGACCATLDSFDSTWRKDIVKQMPTEANLFRKVDVAWRNTMTTAKDIVTLQAFT
eukprot:587970-Amphidinium_carterae.1